MAKFFTELKRRNIYRVAAVCAVVAGCATPNGELPYYELASSGDASVQPAIIEGTAQQSRYATVCAYAYAVDGRSVGPRADCTAAIPILPGKHAIGAWIAGDRHDAVYVGWRNRRHATATLIFDAAEGHRYKISLARVYFRSDIFRAYVWISDETTQTAVTETKLVTPCPAGTGWC